jgi:phosphoribosylformylglycinamidine synthase
VLLLGETRDELGGSEWAWAEHRHLGGTPPTVDLAREKLLAEVLVAGSRDGMLSSAHDLSDGGLAQALVESALAGDRGRGMGARVVLPSGQDPFVQLYSESAGRVLVTVPRSEELRFTEMCDARGLPCTRIGVTDGTGPGRRPRRAGPVRPAAAELREAYEGTLPALFGPLAGAAAPTGRAGVGTRRNRRRAAPPHSAAKAGRPGRVRGRSFRSICRLPPPGGRVWRSFRRTRLRVPPPPGQSA